MVKRAEGCKNFHIAKHTRNASTGAITFETPVRLAGLQDLNLTTGYAEATAYSDNQMDTSVKKPSYVDLTAVLRELSVANEALIMGQTIIGGKKYTSSKDVQPSFAVLYEQTNSDGTSTFRCLYNTTLTRDGVTNTTIGDSVTYDTVSISGRAIPLEDGTLDMVMESDDEGITATDIANFFKAVPAPPAAVATLKDEPAVLKIDKTEK